MPSRNISATESVKTSRPTCRRFHLSELPHETAPSPSRASRSNVCEIAEHAWRHARSRRQRAQGWRPGPRYRAADRRRDGRHVWAERYDRDLDDIFVIQDEISHSIVHALKLKLLPQEKKAIEQRGTTNVEAYKLYLMARQYWVTGNYGDVRRDQRVMRIVKQGGRARPLLRPGLGAAGDGAVQSALCFWMRGRGRGCRRPHRPRDRCGDRRGPLPNGPPPRGTRAICRGRRRDAEGAAARP